MFEDVRSRKVHSNFIGIQITVLPHFHEYKTVTSSGFYITSCRFSTKCLWDINAFRDQPYHRSSSWDFMQGKNKYSSEQHWLLSYLLSVVFSASINKVNVYADETFSVLSWDVCITGGHCTHPIQPTAFCGSKCKALLKLFPRSY